jgi:hypothetical protein
MTIRTRNDPDLTDEQREKLCAAENNSFQQSLRRALAAVSDRMADDFTHHLGRIVEEATREALAECPDLDPAMIEREHSRLSIAYVFAKLSQGDGPELGINSETGEIMEAVAVASISTAETQILVEPRPGETREQAVERTLRARFGPDAVIEHLTREDGEPVVRMQRPGASGAQRHPWGRTPNEGGMN